MSIAILTDKGLEKALVATANNFAFKIALTRFRISNAIPADTSKTDVTQLSGSTVYEGSVDAGNITVKVLDKNTILYSIYLDDTIGDFQIGSVGLYDETDTLFAVRYYPLASPKLQSRLPSQAGNFRTIDIALALTRAEDIFEVKDTDTSDYPTFHTVGNETLLPPTGGEYPGKDFWIVKSFSAYEGLPAIAYYNGGWYTAPIVAPSSPFVFVNAVADLPAVGDPRKMYIANGFTLAMYSEVTGWSVRVLDDTNYVKKVPNVAALPAAADAPSALYYVIDSEGLPAVAYSNGVSWTITQISALPKQAFVRVSSEDDLPDPADADVSYLVEETDTGGPALFYFKGTWQSLPIHTTVVSSINGKSGPLDKLAIEDIDGLPVKLSRSTWPLTAIGDCVSLTNAQKGDIAVVNDYEVTLVLKGADPTVRTNWVTIASKTVLDPYTLVYAGEVSTKARLTYLLNAKPGHIARTYEDYGLWVLDGPNYAQLSDWKFLANSIDNPILTVNGQVGPAVTINVPVTSVNGKADGNVVIGMSDISGLTEAIADAKASGPVTTVAGKAADTSGNVVLSTGDIAGFNAGVIAILPANAVTKLNGLTGEVTLPLSQTLPNVTNKADLLALTTAKRQDFVYVTSEEMVYRLNGEDPTLQTGWVPFASRLSSYIRSINGETGPDLILEIPDVDDIENRLTALEAASGLVDFPITKVAGKAADASGNVALYPADIIGLDDRLTTLGVNYTKVSTVTELLTLSNPVKNTLATVTGTGSLYILEGANPTQEGSWTLIADGNVVKTVNGTGGPNVTLDFITSVDGDTGPAVDLSAKYIKNDVGVINTGHLAAPAGNPGVGWYFLNQVDGDTPGWVESSLSAASKYQSKEVIELTSGAINGTNYGQFIKLKTGPFTLAPITLADAYYLTKDSELIHNGWMAWLKNTGATDIVIEPPITVLIEGSTSYTLPAGKSVCLVCDGRRFLTFAVEGTAEGSPGILSVNGKTDDNVVLTAGDVGAYSTAEVDTKLEALNFIPNANYAVKATHWEKPAAATNGFPNIRMWSPKDNANTWVDYQPIQIRRFFEKSVDTVASASLTINGTYHAKTILLNTGSVTLGSSYVNAPSYNQSLSTDEAIIFNGFYVTIKNITVADATIRPSTGKTIDGQTSHTLKAGESARYIYEGYNWRILYKSATTAAITSVDGDTGPAVVLSDKYEPKNSIIENTRLAKPPVLTESYVKMWDSSTQSFIDIATASLYPYVCPALTVGSAYTIRAIDAGKTFFPAEGNDLTLPAAPLPHGWKATFVAGSTPFRIKARYASNPIDGAMYIDVQPFEVVEVSSNNGKYCTSKARPIPAPDTGEMSYNYVGTSKKAHRQWVTIPTFGSPGIAQSTAHGIASMAEYHIVRGYLFDSISKKSYPLPYSSGSPTENVTVDMDATNVTVMCSSDRPNCSAKILVEYCLS